MKALSALTLAAIALTSIGCARIETGEVGLRRNLDKTISSEELQPGSLNQVIIGSVITFPVKDIPVDIQDKTPMTADNSSLKDFDLTFSYSVNPAAVSELYTQKSSAFHIRSEGDILLMYNFMSQTVNNAIYKAVRQHKALEVADNRARIEQDIKETVTEELRQNKLDTSLTLNFVQVRNTLPADPIIASANEVVRAQNELKTKEIEVQTARREAERVAALNANGNAIAYMQAQAGMVIAEAIKAGKVQTIVVPQDFKGIVNVK